MANAVNSSDFAVKYSISNQKAAADNDSRAEALRHEADLKNIDEATGQREINLRKIADQESGRAGNISRVV